MIVDGVSECVDLVVGIEEEVGKLVVEGWVLLFDELGIVIRVLFHVFKGEQVLGLVAGDESVVDGAVLEGEFDLSCCPRIGGKGDEILLDFVQDFVF